MLLRKLAFLEAPVKTELDDLALSSNSVENYYSTHKKKKSF